MKTKRQEKDNTNWSSSAAPTKQKQIKQNTNQDRKNKMDKNTANPKHKSKSFDSVG